MALARAFTTKKGSSKEDRPSMPQAPSRSFFSSKPTPSIRNKISSPLALISTTNQLAYNAPDIFPNSSTSTPVSATSKTFAPLTLSTNIGTSLADQDEVPELLHSNSSTPDSSTRGSTPTSTEPNHLSGYFAAAVEAKRNSDEAPVRSMSRAGKVGELLGRKRSESRIRSPSGSLGHGAARKPSLQSIDSAPKSANSSVPSWQSGGTAASSVASTPATQFAPAPFNSATKSPTTERFAPAAFTHAPFNSGPKSAPLVPLGGGGGLMRKNTVRARGSIDMFSPGMGVGLDKIDSKPSLSNLRERRADDNKPRNFNLSDRAMPEENVKVAPSLSLRDRQISNPSPLQSVRSPISPKPSASHADLRGQAQERHPALRAKASLNIRPSTADKVVPPARSFTTNNAPSPMGMRKASPIDEAMATLDEVAKDFNVQRQVKREEKKQFKTVITAQHACPPKTRIVEGEKTFMADNAHTFTALDYMSEIQDLSEYLFPELKSRREAADRNLTRGMAGVVKAAQMQQYNMI